MKSWAWGNLKDKILMFKRGYIQTEEHKRKIGLGNKGKIISEESRKKISNSLKGRKLPKETKKKISKRLKGRNFGYKWENGHKLSEKTKSKISKARIRYFDRIGRKLPRNKHDGTKYVRWRLEVFLRDNWTCQFCGKRNCIGLGKSVYLEAHHIKSWTKYPMLRYITNNGITLCREDHKLANKIQRKEDKLGVGV